jgi:Asp-tRNA(Asn)/Glu-tRNA(Gln) amidotransferase A subunit family amidase
MLSALDLVRRIEAGALTPSAVIDLCAAAIAAREPEVGAFVTLDLDGARRQALAARPDQALRGLPVGIKDIIDTCDLPTAYGTPIYAGHRPRADAAIVTLVRRAGGTIIGKTVTTELAFLQPPKTRNPHNLARGPGGSSSGSAAGVAAGMFPIAIGSQTGGSVIRPAAYCGVAGFKPSFKLLPTVGMKCFSWTLDTTGLFAASVADVAFAAAAISGRDLRIDGAPPAAPRIGLLRTPIWNEASADMRAAVERAARLAQAAGATVIDLELPELLQEAHRLHPTIQDYEAYRALGFEYDRHRDQLGPLLRDLLDRAATISHDDYDRARRATKHARKAVFELMDDVDVLLTPSAPGAAPDPDSTGAAIFNRLWTLMGLPCVNVPGLRDASHMPLGIQIVGRFARDRQALEAAAFVERAIAARA